MRILIILASLAVAVCGTIILPARKPLITSVLPKPVPPRRVICYMGKTDLIHTNIGLVDVTEINSSICTHVIVSFVILDFNKPFFITNVRPENIPNLMNNLISLKQRQVKIMWSWSGWNENAISMDTMISTPESRSLIVKRVVNWIVSNHDHGLDLDWAYSSVVKVNFENQLALLSDLRVALSSQKLVLSVATASNVQITRSCYKVADMIKYVDWFNLKGYEFNTFLEKSNLMAPLYDLKVSNVVISSIDIAVQFWLKLGVPAEKLVLGIPMVGVEYTLIDANDCTPGASVAGLKRVLNYNEVCPMLINEKWNINWATIQRVDWAAKNNHWITWSSVRSVAERALYAKRMRLGGVAVWGIDRDDYNGVCGPKWPLLKSISKVVHPTVSPAIIPPIPVLKPNLKCNAFGFAADVKNPNKFYRCLSKGALAYHCPHGLIFDTVLSICTWPYKF